MSSNIYHRNLQPSGPPPHARLNESFDTIRQEFDALSQELVSLRGQRDDYDQKLASQVNELNIIRQSLYDLEAQHSKVRQQYDEEVARLRSELEQLRRAHPPGPPPGPTGGPGGPPGLTQPGGPPSAGPPPSGGIPPGYPPGEGYHPYPRDPERDRERERGRRDDRERERERERERDRVPGPDRVELLDRAERERDRERDTRDLKRIKPDRMKSDRGDPYSPSMHAGPSSGKPLPLGAPSGPGLPPASRPPGPSGDYPMSDPAPTPRHGPTGPPSMFSEAEFLDGIDPANCPPELKKEGSDWFAVWNPKVKRVLDVNLVHTLSHESVVCCVRFSADGKYLATGCNRTAQIFDVKTGEKTCVLSDENTNKNGDLYIRSVCFSPDGKYLATGAEDKRIRIWDIAKKRIRNVFDGHQQEIYSLEFSRDGRLIVSGSGDKTARVWDITAAEGGPGAPGPLTRVLTIDETLDTDAGVTSVAISPDGRLVAAGSLDFAVRIWDVASGQLVERLRGHKDSVYSVAFTPDGKGLVSGSLDKTLKYWDIRALQRSPGQPLPPVRAGEERATCAMNFLGHKDYVLSVAVSADGQWVVSGSKDRGVQFWDARTATVQLMLQGHKNSVISIDLNPVGGVLASGSGDWQARIWSYKSV